jgi:hypothetical protein
MRVTGMEKPFGRPRHRSVDNNKNYLQETG